MDINTKRGLIPNGGGQSRLTFAEFWISGKDEQRLLRWGFQKSGRFSCLAFRDVPGRQRFRGKDTICPGFTSGILPSGAAELPILVREPFPCIGHGSQQVNAEKDGCPEPMQELQEFVQGLH